MIGEPRGGLLCVLCLAVGSNVGEAGAETEDLVLAEGGNTMWSDNLRGSHGLGTTSKGWAPRHESRIGVWE